MLRSFGRYDLVRRIAVGGMAEIYLARVETMSRPVVVKRLLPDLQNERGFVTMFLDEARLAARLRHPNIAEVYEAGQIEGRYFIAMEYVPGADLGSVMSRLERSGERLPMGVALAVGIAVARGLAYAHEQHGDDGALLELVHRDVSPQNILLSESGDVKLTDFGIAKAAGRTSKTKSGVLKGKFGYLSPEQALGRAVDKRADIFSLGLVLYEMLSHTRAYPTDDELKALELARTAKLAPLTGFSEIPEGLAQVVHRALAILPHERYASGGELAEALTTGGVGWPALARPEEIAALVRPSSGRITAEMEPVPDMAPAGDELDDEPLLPAWSASTPPRAGYALEPAAESELAPGGEPKSRRLAASMVVGGLVATLGVYVWQNSFEPEAHEIHPRRESSLAHPGYLTVTTSEPAYLYVDGERLPEPTPVTSWRVIPGKHSLRVVPVDGGHAQELTIDVAPDRTVTRHVSF